jgi:hypothetical protein
MSSNKTLFPEKDFSQVFTGIVELLALVFSCFIIIMFFVETLDVIVRVSLALYGG